jgi:hypothetical protein
MCEYFGAQKIAESLNEPINLKDCLPYATPSMQRACEEGTGPAALVETASQFASMRTFRRHRQKLLDLLRGVDPPRVSVCVYLPLECACK